MTDFGTALISGSDLGQFGTAYNAIITALPREMAKRLSDIQRNYFARYGLQGVFERMNNRSVAQIFEEYRPVEVKPIASGEVDDVRYALYEPPPSTEDERPE